MFPQRVQNMFTITVSTGAGGGPVSTGAAGGLIEIIPITDHWLHWKI